jgi:hypothetical protein
VPGWTGSASSGGRFGRLTCWRRFGRRQGRARTVRLSDAPRLSQERTAVGGNQPDTRTRPVGLRGANTPIYVPGERPTTYSDAGRLPYATVSVGSVALHRIVANSGYPGIKLPAQSPPFAGRGLPR